MVKNEDWLLHFSALESVNPDKIRPLLEGLPINKSIKLPSFFSRLRRHSYLKNLEEAVSLIVNFFEKEMRAHIKDIKKESIPYSKDFVVHKIEGEGLTEYIHFDVRLYHPTKSGNIFYGLKVAKVERDKFVLIH